MRVDKGQLSSAVILPTAALLELRLRGSTPLDSLNLPRKQGTCTALSLAAGAATRSPGAHETF